MAILMVWCLLGVIAGMVAQQKYRNVWAWSISTFFLGFFTLIPLLLLKPLDNPLEFRACPQCGENILLVAKICKHCNSSVTALS